MKEKYYSKIQKLAKIADLTDGKFAGGFEIISASSMLIAFGGDETNNCDGGNCAAGCAQTNTKEGCGGTVNAVAGCGVKNN